MAERQDGTAHSTCSVDRSHPARCVRRSPVFFRDGDCATGPADLGQHVVCAVMAADFLAFSRLRGKDLITPVPVYGFPGLKPGARGCLCGARWKEARQAGSAPQALLAATRLKPIEIVSFSDLKPYALDLS
jgi:uncharacterized protein (DUF2237 family)